MILQHSPQRFGQLIAEATDETMRANLATLLPRLGAGEEALGRCLDHPWLKEATPEEFALDARFRAKWPPLRSEDIEPGVLAGMAERAASPIDCPQTEIRNAALAVLGRLPAAGHVERIIGHAVHGDASTRLAAIRALAQIGEASASGSKRLKKAAAASSTAGSKRTLRPDPRVRQHTRSASAMAPNRVATVRSPRCCISPCRRSIRTRSRT